MVDLSDYSVLNYLSDHGGHMCGYCGRTDSNYSRGLWAYRLTCADYEELINRGCRRSGHYIYKPTMDISCCPCYTIKCDPLNFKLSKSQKKVLKNMTRFLKTGQKRNFTPKELEEEEEEEEDFSGGWTRIRVPVDRGPSEAQKRAQMKAAAEKAAKEAAEKAAKEAAEGGASSKEGAGETESGKPGDSDGEDTPMEGDNSSKTEQRPSKKQAKMPRPGKGADPTKAPRKKAKQLRRERKLAKLAQKGAPDSQTKPSQEAVPSDKPEKSEDATVDGPKDAETSEGSSVDPPVESYSKQKEKTLHDYVKEHNDPGPGAKHKLEVSLVRSAPKRWPYTESSDESYALYQKYQRIIHEDPPERCTEKQLTLLRAAGPDCEEYLRTRDETFTLFQKYQRIIHEDPEEEWELADFNRFLVDSPLTEIYPIGAPKHGFGTFHQHYRLDGKLIAVAVLDILPTSVSSVYFYYDPDYGFLSLGNYSALREIAFTQVLHEKLEQMEHYYMGLYIHECPKMKYKRHFHPSYLLCPMAYTWVPLEKCAPKLDKTPYCRLDETDKEDEPGDYKKALLFYQRMIMPYDVYQMASQMGEYYTEEIKEYVETVGKKCSQKLLLVLS